MSSALQYSFRQCAEGDRAWAYALKSEAYHEVVERQFGPWEEQFQRELFSARWSPAISKILLVDGKAAGLVAVEDRGDEVWIDEVQVVREWRGKGLGSSIIRDLLNRARAAHKPLKLQVLKENMRAQKLYRRLGFSLIGETKTHYLTEAR
jgi:ribosomal protein S18 acetylase RimI-like enzyme